MYRKLLLVLAPILLLSGMVFAGTTESLVQRGKYLVTFGGCNDCHGKPDRYLGGSDVGFAIPGLGVFVAPNLTPDKQTGLGNWTRQQIVTAFTTGKLPNGRILAPIMPWGTYSQLSEEDAQAIAVYLQSLKPVKYQVPGPFGPTQKVTVFVHTALPAVVYNNSLPKSPPSPVN